MRIGAFGGLASDVTPQPERSIQSASASSFVSRERAETSVVKMDDTELLTAVGAVVMHPAYALIVHTPTLRTEAFRVLSGSSLEVPPQGGVALRMSRADCRAAFHRARGRRHERRRQKNASVAQDRLPHHGPPLPEVQKPYQRQVVGAPLRGGGGGPCNVGPGARW